MLAIGTIEHRQQREGAVGIEDFPSDVFVRLAVVEPRDHCAVAVIPAGHLEPGFLAAGRTAPFRADHQRGLEHRAIAQRCRNAELAAVARHHLDRRVPADQRFLLCRFVQRKA